VQVPGTARLARWGVLEALIAAGTPPTRAVRFDPGNVVVSARMPTVGGVDLMCSPRRTLLDKLLVEAARAAGAEVRENFIAAELTTDDGVVTGIRGALKGGATVCEQAKLVIGADGKHSMVAKSVAAQEYRVRSPRTLAYYTYWSGVAMSGGEIYSRPGMAIGAWPTGDGLTMTYLARPVGEHADFRRDVEGNFLASLDSVGLGERIKCGERAERYRGTPDLPNFFRTPYGPGWALVGDAGLVMDPITDQGIADAFRDAELLAGAVAAGLGARRI
jgi:2-polyprenyl-6-methoxyphenol hydroxylase-like FAD-dependent oxidoreductase